jgi:hypothetical protein
MDFEPHSASSLRGLMNHNGLSVCLWATRFPVLVDLTDLLAWDEAVCQGKTVYRQTKSEC